MNLALQPQIGAVARRGHSGHGGGLALVAGPAGGFAKQAERRLAPRRCGGADAAPTQPGAAVARRLEAVGAKVR